MNVPPWAGFVADYPDDQVESGGDIQVYGGRNVALALAEIFTGLGCRRVSDIKSEGDQGWAFDVYDGGNHRFWCRVQSFHPVFWLLFDDVSGSKKGAEAYVDLWRKFGNALERDPRFRQILWRPFKAGPPDWDEVEAASDPPERTFDEEFPPTAIQPKTPKLGCSPWLAALVFIVWPIASGVTSIFYRSEGHSPFDRLGYVVIGIVLISVGFGFLYLFALGILNSWRAARAPGGSPAP